MRYLAYLALAAGCSGSGAGTDAGDGVPDAQTKTCGCAAATAGETCVSFETYDWVRRTPLGPDDGLSVYVVAASDYGAVAAPLATGQPDAEGRVVLEEFVVPAGELIYAVLDDTPGTGNDAWTHIGIGPLLVPGISECVEAPAVSRADGDVFLEDIGSPRGQGAILHGAVILDVRDETGNPRSDVGLDSAPAVGTNYFTDDRAHVDTARVDTSAAGAALTTAATWCSVSCSNIECICGDLTCGYRTSGPGGAPDGFFFDVMVCHR